MDIVRLEKDFIDAVEDVVWLLKEKNYLEIVRLPYLKGNVFSFINDLKFFLKKETGLFGSSFLYALRRRLFHDKGLLLLCDFFRDNKMVAYSKAIQVLGEERLRRLLKVGILSEEIGINGGTFLRSEVRIIPFNEEYFVSDPFDRNIRNFVWIGADSILLADRLKRLNFNWKSAVDIGSGSGIQAVALPNGSDAMTIGIDINEKGLRYGRLNAAINKKTNVRFIKSDMLSAIKAGVDLIVSNPPFIFLPGTEKAVNRDGYGGALGIEKMVEILQNLPQHLNPGGRAILLTLSPVISGRDILIEETKKIFHDGYLINYEIIDYVYNSEFKDLYDSKNISYFVQGILEIIKEGDSSNTKISIKDISKMKKFFSIIKCNYKGFLQRR